MKIHKEDPQKVYRVTSSQFDLTESTHQNSLLKLANSLLDLKYTSSAQLVALAQKEDSPLLFKVAVQLVQSRKYLQLITKPISIGIVFSMCEDHHHLLKKSTSNINAENSLLTKMNQLQWASKGTKVDWHLYPVDDGCPHHSFDSVSRIARLSSRPEKITVLKLKDEINAHPSLLAKLNDVNDTIKGGAIIYTDADNSIDIGQIGLILAPFMASNAQVVPGNREVHPIY